jgi:hypothetical protein
MSKDLRQLLSKAISETINAMSDAQLKTMMLDPLIELAAQTAPAVQPVAFYVYEWINLGDGTVFRSFRADKQFGRWPDRTVAVPRPPAQPAPEPPTKSTPIDIAKYFIEHAIGCVQGLQVVQYVGDPHGHWKNCAVLALHSALDELKKAAAEKGGAS